MNAIDSIPSFTKINFAKLRAKKLKPIKPSMAKRKMMAAYLVRIGFNVAEACRSVRLSTDDYYGRKK
jgi:hypothetical protein